MDEIKDICLLVQGEQNNSLKELLYQLMLDDDRLVAVNALDVYPFRCRRQCLDVCRPQVALCNKGAVHQACLRADEILARTA